MGPRKTPLKGTTRGNFIAEWFGHRVWPTLDTSSTASEHQSKRLCPFISAATKLQSLCIKASKGYDEPVGVCTISSDSNGKRQDWLACPFRTLDQHFTLLETAIRISYRIPAEINIELLPITILNKESNQRIILQSIESTKTRVFVFSASKLGGEIDIPETEASPGGKVDISVIEIKDASFLNNPLNGLGQHMLFEIQTADFHGSPLHAAGLLKTHFPRGAPCFNPGFLELLDVCGTGVEGPNKANIFKRTIYQMLFKIQLSADPSCAGFVIILPVPVWESWVRHLGEPKLHPCDTDQSKYFLLGPNDRISDFVKSWILVFDIDRDSKESPQPLKIIAKVAASSSALLHYAFQVASKEALSKGVINRFREVFGQKVVKGWRGRIAPEDKADIPQGALPENPPEPRPA